MPCVKMLNVSHKRCLVFKTAIGANYVFVKTVLCAHTRYYFKTHELGGPVMALVHVNLA